MQAEIITIGDELLIGQVVDTNSTWLGRTLGEDGIKVTQITSVQDDADQIARAVNEALARVSIVLVTGGLGPTRDDITKHTLAELFGMRLVRDEQVYETVRRQLAVRGIAFNELNRGQALVPDGLYGTAEPQRYGPGNVVRARRENIGVDARRTVRNESAGHGRSTAAPADALLAACERSPHRDHLRTGRIDPRRADRAVGNGAAANLRLAYLPSALASGCGFRPTKPIRRRPAARSAGNSTG